jgi:putative transposase
MNCPQCRSTFNERTGTPFNYLEFPTDIVLLAVVWRMRYKLSLSDVAEMFLERGFTFTHEAIRDWETRFASLNRRSTADETTWSGRDILVR